MKISILCAIVLLAVQTCHGGALQDKMLEIGNNFKQAGDNIKNDLKDVGDALLEHGQNQFTGLLKEGLSAVIGAVISSAEGFDITKIFNFGKREMDGTIDAIIEWAGDNEENIKRIFQQNKERIHVVIDEIAGGQFDMEDLEEKLRQINEKHEMEVRGVIGDTLNTGIDWIRGVWDKIFKPADPEVSDPLMISRRSLPDILSKFTETIKPHLDNVVQITKDITSTLAHHAGKIWDQHKDAAINTVKEMLSGLHETLQKHLSGQQNTLTGDEGALGY